MSLLKKVFIISIIAAAISFVMTFTNDENFMCWVMKTSVVMFSLGILLSSFGFFRQGFSGPSMLKNFGKGYDEETDIKVISSNFNTGIAVMLSGGVLYLMVLLLNLLK